MVVRAVTLVKTPTLREACKEQYTHVLLLGRCSGQLLKEGLWGTDGIYDVHSSSLAEAQLVNRPKGADGGDWESNTLFVTWFAGTEENAPDVAVFLSSYNTSTVREHHVTSGRSGCQILTLIGNAVGAMEHTQRS